VHHQPAAILLVQQPGSSHLDTGDARLFFTLSVFDGFLTSGVDGFLTSGVDLDSRIKKVAEWPRSFVNTEEPGRLIRFMSPASATAALHHIEVKASPSS
jgi:hypothetical protein